MLLRKLSLILLAGVLLVGCNNEKTRNLIDQRKTEAEQGIQDAYAPAAPKPYNALSISDKVWAGKAAFRMHRGIPLPSKYESSRGMTIVTADPMNLTEIASLISSQTGIPTRIAPGTEQTGPSRGAARSEAGAGSLTMPLAYEGTLSGLLDLVCGYYNINWKYDGSSIYLSRFETRVFLIESLPGTQTIKEGMKEASSSSGSTGSSSSNDLQQTSEMNLELKVWEELGQTVTALLNGTGSAVVAPSSGTITVTTTPELMRLVAKFISDENKRLSQQIAVNIEVYTVSLSDSTDFNISFKTALNFMGGSYSGGSATTAAATTGGGMLNLAIFNPAHVKSATSLFSALTKIGDTTRVAQFPLTTLNNRPVSRRIGRDQAYVQSVTNSTSTNFSNSAVTPGTIREGFSIQVTPRVLDDGRIMLQYSLSLIDIISIEPFTAGETSVQLPETSSRIFVQQSMLKSGSTLVIGGYDDEKATQSSQGVGSAFNYFLGGGVKNETGRTMMFIAITPQVIELPRSEQE